MLSYLETSNGFIELTQNDQAEASSDWIDLPNAVQLKLHGRGILQIKPAQNSSQDFVMSCGIHGNETAPIEIVSDLISKIVMGEIEPKVNLLFIIGNPESMKISQRFVHLNMNRLFNEAYKNYELTDESRYEIERAIELESIIKLFYKPNSKKYHYDLHTAIKPSFHKTFAIRPYAKQPISLASKKCLQAMGIEAVLQHNKPSTTFSAFSYQTFDAESYTLELGKVKPFGKNDPKDFKKAIDCLTHLIIDKPIPSSTKKIIEYKVVAEIIRQSDAFKFHVAEDVENFTAFPQGYLVAEDSDYNYRVAFKEESVVFPNVNVPIGQRVAVMVTKVGQE